MLLARLMRSSASVRKRSALSFMSSSFPWLRVKQPTRANDPSLPQHVVGLRAPVGANACGPAKLSHLSLPPEAFKAGIEIIDRQIILSAGAPDFVISLEGTAEGCADARRGKSGAKPAATTESRDRVHMN